MPLQLGRNVTTQFTRPCLAISKASRSPPSRFKSCSESSTNQVIFSGIQPTGTPHIGNYLGALRQWVKLQDRAHPSTTLIYSIVNAHAITVPHDEEQLRKWKRETLGILLAIGLDPERSMIYYQSDVKAHFELQWILSCTASSMGYLQRMTQWKSKMSLPEDTTASESAFKDALKLGLFSYPVLQAADILLHRATHVPVGEDQEQHLEFARRCAKMFNSSKGDYLPLPQTILSPARRVMSLNQPHLKMSKSHTDPKSRILITDTYEEIKQKIRLALTDSISGVTYDPVNRPGVSNLLEIMSNFQESDKTCDSLATEYESLSMREFKERVAESIENGISGIRARYEKISDADGGHYLDFIEVKGAEKARLHAEETMAFLRKTVAF
ncbi:MAG: Tryptophan--tRNA ligase, mitochondrial [Sclerophora amabilis]|nr:MAG: Tryptophan--tRNA ligase, mitochondrial [Sclerophora amabilis]